MTSICLQIYNFFHKLPNFSASTTRAKPSALKFAVLPQIDYLCTMARILSIDFGRRRCGIAVTDPACIVANGLTTVATADLIDFVTGYVSREGVETVVVGLPTDMHGRPSESMRYLEPAINRLRKLIAPVPVVFYDERFTSVLAHKAMIDGGMKKMDRRNKAIVDEISAAIILNDYLTHRR